MENLKVCPAKLMDSIPEDVHLSSAMKRVYKNGCGEDDRDNEFFTNFKYSKITGVGKEEGVTRRDPSKVIMVDGVYYVYYTHRRTKNFCPVGIFANNTEDDIATYDWDLSDIYYATSVDGFEWEEKGPAVERAPKGEYGDRSLSTPDVLVWEGKYYLYYQTFTGYFSRETQDYCGVSMAWADSPDGPWTKTTEPVVEQGEREDWDSMAIHDPYPLVYQGKIWMFYKGENLRIGGEENNIIRAQGVAIADRPEGPYIKHPLNPIVNSGHETFLFPYNEGLAAVLTFDGVEKDTIQYAPDGINYKLMSHIHVPPLAAGPYSPDAFNDNGDADGVTWGLSHIETRKIIDGANITVATYMVRFDCDLDRRFTRKVFRNPDDYYGQYCAETYDRYNMKLPDNVRQELIKKALEKGGYESED